MSHEWEGKVIRQHTDKGATDLGRIVHVGRHQPVICWIPLPHTRPKGADAEDRNAAKDPDERQEDSHARVFHLKAPRIWEKTDLAAKLADPRGAYTLVDYSEPTAWRYTDEELRQGFALSDLGQKHRWNTRAWLEKRDEQKSWIHPIVTELTAYELLELGRLNDEVRKRAKELGHSNPAKVARAMRQYLLGCGHPNALLPAWAASGCSGQEKFPRTKCGRRPRPVLRGRSNHLGFVTTKSSRRDLVAGWRKYKKRGTTEYKAYLLTCEEYWPGNVDVLDEDGKRYLLAPPEERPTLSEFRLAAHRRSLTAKAANMSKRVYDMVARALRGKFDDRLMAVGQLGLIDSTSEDQTPVSSISRLKILPSTWRTIVMEGKTGYILGMHSGFECPSTLTSLLALHNCRCDKVAFCARWGVLITPEQWYSMVCKRIRADNGELKSETGIKTLNCSECTVEFVRSFGSYHKGPVEAGHHSLHRRGDHDASGSTRGHQQERGEPDCAEDACRNHGDHMPVIIDTVLYHINVEPVPDLLTTDMRRDGVKPTRKAIFEWYVRNGYVASEPWNMELLRTRCLPRISARIYRDGIHLIDPLDTHCPARLIPQLHYSSEWLIQCGLLVKAGRGVIECEVLLDPNDLSRCYFDHAGELHELERRTSDPRANELTLCEHLLMVEDDRDTLDDMKARVEEKEARIVRENRDTNKRATAAKREEQQATSSKKPGKQTRQKREHRREELRRNSLQALGLDPDGAAPQRNSASDPGLDHSPPAVPDSEYRSELAEHLADQWEVS